MPKAYTPSPKLRMVVDHLNAVRTLDEYVTGVGLKDDLQDLSTHIQDKLTQEILRPHGWEDLYSEGRILYSNPKSRPLWRVVRGDVVSIEIAVTSPVRYANEPYVNLYVPPSWRKRKRFIDHLKSKTPPGFEHVSSYTEGELADWTSIFQDVPYEDHVGHKGPFNLTTFVESFAKATEALVAMENSIERILGKLAEARDDSV